MAAHCTRKFLRHGTRFAGMLCVAFPGVSLASMTSLSEDEMAAVDAQDGLSVVFGSSTITAQQLRLDLDNPGANQAHLNLDTVTLTGVNADGTSTGLPFTYSMLMDVGAVDTASLPGASFQFAWSRSRLRADYIRHKADAVKSFGAIAFDTSGSVVIASESSLLNNAATLSTLRINVNNGEWYYRQNNNEFLWDNFTADLGFDAGGSFGVNDGGFNIIAPRFDFNLEWDMAYRANVPLAGETFRSNTKVAPYLHYGWSGQVKNVQWTIVGGGFGSTEGIKLTWRADAYNNPLDVNDPDNFQWIIGDAAKSPAVIYFRNWTTMPGATASMNANVTLDVINAGQGPGGFTYKGVNTDTLFNAATPDAGGLGVSIRNFEYLAYNTQVRIVDTSRADWAANPTPFSKDFNWALIYTLGDIDLNLFAYPGGKASVNPNEGVRFDLTLGVQSPSTWNKNTHFLIADTDASKNVGIGFIDTNFLIQINDGYLTLLTTGMEMETTTDFLWKLEGKFGGGFLTDLSKPVRMFDLDATLHASRIRALFAPPPSGQTYIGFEWDARLYQSNAADRTTADSYFAVAEPSKPTVKWTFGQLGGDLQVRNGKIDLRGGGESSDGQTRLVFEQDLRFGLSATNATFFAGANTACTTYAAAANCPAVMNNMSIGTSKIGALAFPGGKYTAIFALKEQQ